MSFEHLLALPGLERSRNRLVKVQLELGESERIRAVSPVAGVLHCRRAFEVLIEVFEVELLGETGGRSGETIAERVDVISQCWTASGHGGVAQPLQSLLECYREWCKYVHPRQTASESTCMKALRSFHLVSCELVEALGGTVLDTEYRPTTAAKLANGQDEQALQGEIDRLQLNLDNLQREFQRAERTSATARQQCLEARSERDEAVRRLEAVGDSTALKETVAAANRKVAQLETRENELSERLRDVGSHLDIHLRESMDLKDELRRVKLERAAAVGTTVALEREVADLRDELEQLRETHDSQKHDLVRLHGEVEVYGKARMDSQALLRSAEHALHDALARQRSGDSSRGPGANLASLEGEVIRLRDEMVQSEGRLEQARRAERAALHAALAAESTLEQVSAKLVRANAERDRLASRLVVTERYEREYPGLQGAAEFLRQSLE